jgi:hypothetical protein
MYAVFDLGVTFYWTIPTAPPWWAAREGRMGRRAGGRAVGAEGDGLTESEDSGLFLSPSERYRPRSAAAGQEVEVRRMMIEYGPLFWGDLWTPLYAFLGGNPLAAMPSLHFATSVMSAHLLSEVGPVPGAVGWTYAGALGLALVYLGEHYLVDLIGGAALTEAIRLGAPRAGPLGRRLGSGLETLRTLGTTEPPTLGAAE